MTRPKQYARSVSIGLLAVGIAMADHPIADVTAQKVASTPSGPTSPGTIEIRGTVVDGRGKPLGNVAVCVLGTSDKRAVPVKTAADGSFRIHAEAANVGHLILWATTNNNSLQGTYCFQGADPPLGKTESVGITLRPAIRTVVRVADRRKKPIAAANVAIIDDMGYPLFTRQTDTRGQTAIDLPADARIRQVIALKAGVGFDYYENYRAWPGVADLALPAEVGLVLDGSRTVSVQVIDSADKPLPEIRLIPWSIQKPGKLSYAIISGLLLVPGFAFRSNAGGMARCEWIPSRLQGRVIFLCQSPDYSLPEPPYFDPAQHTPRLTARLLRNGVVEGTVRLPDGKPAPGVLVQAEGRGKTHRYCRRFARSGADGTYAMQLSPEQSYIVAVLAATKCVSAKARTRFRGRRRAQSVCRSGSKQGLSGISTQVGCHGVCFKGVSRITAAGRSPTTRLRSPALSPDAAQ